jgi:hypothetical protein
MDIKNGTEGADGVAQVDKFLPSNRRPSSSTPGTGGKKNKTQNKKKKMQNGTEVFGLGNWEDLHSLLGSGGRGLKGSGEGGV